MRQIGIYIFIVFTIFTISSCENKKQTTNNYSTITIKEPEEIYQSLKLIDSFIKINKSNIEKNTVLKEKYEALCTNQMLPLIDKKGLYNDLPFELMATAMNNGKIYGNFIYEDEKYYVKVTCIIKNSQLENLQENNKYYIKFNTAKFESGVSFENEFSKIELPIVNGYLKSFTPLKK